MKNTKHYLAATLAVVLLASACSKNSSGAASSGSSSSGSSGASSSSSGAASSSSSSSSSGGASSSSSSSSSGSSSSSSSGGSSGTSSLNGTYFDTSDSGKRIFVTFFGDRYYAFARRGPGNDGCDANYTEFGTYRWSRSSGALSTSILITSNAGNLCGLDPSGTLSVISSTAPVSLSYISNSDPSHKTHTITAVGDGGLNHVVGSFHVEDFSCGTGSTMTGTIPNASNSTSCQGLASTYQHANVNVITFLDSSHVFNINFDSTSPVGGGIDDLCYSVSGNQYSFTTTGCTVAGGFAPEAMSSNSINGNTVSASFPAGNNADGTAAGDWFQYSVSGYTDSADRIKAALSQ